MTIKNMLIFGETVTIPGPTNLASLWIRSGLVHDICLVSGVISDGSESIRSDLKIVQIFDHFWTQSLIFLIGTLIFYRSEKIPYQQQHRNHGFEVVLGY